MNIIRKGNEWKPNKHLPQILNKRVHLSQSECFLFHKKFQKYPKESPNPQNGPNLGDLCSIVLKSASNKRDSVLNVCSKCALMKRCLIFCSKSAYTERESMLDLCSKGEYAPNMLTASGNRCLVCAQRELQSLIPSKFKFGDLPLISWETDIKMHILSGYRS